MLLAAPGQLVSVSRLASDPRASAMAAEAQGFHANGGSAEEVVFLRPDLVLAGRWTTRATVQMLQRLGYRVEIFDPVTSLDGARNNILRMGRVLGQTDKARAVIDEFDQRRAALTVRSGKRPRTVFYLPYGATAGADTLAGDLITAAGMDNLAQDGAHLSMEALVLADPDLILVGRPYAGHARAQDYARHPALRGSGALREIPDGADWTCETPHLMDALRALRGLRDDWLAAP